MAAVRPPSVDSVVRRLDDGAVPRPLVVETVREVIAEARLDPDVDIDTEARRRLDLLQKALPRRVINATGVLLHTNLGRAPLSYDAAAAAAEVARGYSNTELDLTTGQRGKRNAPIERLLVTLTGAEAALVVNNNAGAVFLTLAALAAGGRVPVSRGELIEIGGSYRLPDLMAATGAELVEVGTTNRTRRSDYAAVEDPALLLKVHPSNYRVLGFTAEASITDLSSLASERDVPLVYDVGSGLLDTQAPWLPPPPPTWLAGEPGVRQALDAGADLVLFSGDKLLGGPQAGVIVGDRSLVTRLAEHPAARALRIDGPTAAALAATLQAYLDGRASQLPLWRMATTATEEIERRARRGGEEAGGTAASTADTSTLGAGSAPGAQIPTVVVELDEADRRFAHLLEQPTPVLGRRAAGRLILDLRTVDPSDDHVVAAALAES